MPPRKTGRLPIRSAPAVFAMVLCVTVLLPVTAGAQADSTARRQQRTLDSLTAVIRALTARIDSIEKSQIAGLGPDQAPIDELAAVRAAAAAAASRDSTQVPQAEQPRRGLNALNPEISATGVITAHGRDPGPQVDPFVPREFEVAMQSALDPFSTAKIYLGIEDGAVSLEEGYAYFTSLPAHLRLDVGQFRQQVGELNRWHLHALPEDEYPLVMRRFAGEEGLVATGASVYWPLPFSGSKGAYELTVQATTGENDVLFAGGRRPAVNAQLSGFWQFTRSTYAQLSVSGLRGTNPDTSLTTTLGVAAARFSWRPPQQALSRDLTVRAEWWALKRKFDLTGVDFFDQTRYGGYVSGTWKLNRQWILGMRGDKVQNPEPGPRVHEWAVTPSLTYWQSEFVYLRGLYERASDYSKSITNRFSLQLVFAMGPHKHEIF